MKQKLCALKCGLTFLIVIAASFASSHEAHKKTAGPVHADVVTLNEINEAYLKSVKQVFQKACLDCHSDQTKYPWYSSLPGVKKLIANDISEARKHLDMSADFPFKSHASPKEDLDAIAKVLADKSMPPARYRILHPKSRISEAELETVTGWIKESLESLSLKGN